MSLIWSDYHDPEAIEAERLDADRELAELEAAGREAGRKLRRADRLRAEGRLAEAAEACPHGGGYPLRSIAARTSNDPRFGEDGVRCSDCFSVLSAFPFDDEDVRVLYPCEPEPVR